MPEEIDPAIANDLVTAAMSLLPLTPGNKVLCTKRQLRDCMLRLAQDAYAMGSSRKRRCTLARPPCGI
jgi:hypothetical protein